MLFLIALFFSSRGSQLDLFLSIVGNAALRGSINIGAEVEESLSPSASLQRGNSIKALFLLYLENGELPALFTKGDAD